MTASKPQKPLIPWQAGVADAPGFILIGVGLHEKFNPNSPLVPEAWQFDNYANWMLVAGAAIVIPVAIWTFSVFRKRLREQRELDPTRRHKTVED